MQLASLMSILEEHEIFLENEDESSDNDADADADADDENLRNSRKVDARNFSGRSARSAKVRIKSANYDNSRKDRKVSMLINLKIELIRIDKKCCSCFQFLSHFLTLLIFHSLYFSDSYLCI